MCYRQMPRVEPKSRHGTSSVASGARGSSALRSLSPTGKPAAKPTMATPPAGNRTKLQGKQPVKRAKLDVAIADIP